MRERPLLAIGEHSAALLQRGSAIEEARAAQIDWSLTVGENAAALQPVLVRAGTLDVVVDDRLVRYFVVTPPEGTASLAELRTVATVRLGELFGIDPLAFELAADWRVAGAFLCCAIPSAIKQSVDQAAGLARVSIASLAPLYVRVANSASAARRHSGWVVVRANGWVTAANLHNGAIRLVRSGALETLRQLEPWLAQLALTCGQSVATPLVLDADQPHKLPADWGRLERDRRDVELLATFNLAETH
ncbi:MAG TPA: hypothetical protein VEN28_09130 [Burkholderiaceae bacterium]|nr:hypothetical protein [Burkholderiaceae bacterium]